MLRDPKLLAFSSAPTPKRQKGIVDNDPDNNDGVSDHDSDDDVMNKKMECEFENNETKGNDNMNQDWMSIFSIKDILLNIIEFNESRDIFNILFNTCKIFNKQKTNTKITQDTCIFRILQNPNEFRAQEFLKPGKSNVQCTLQSIKIISCYDRDSNMQLMI